MKQNEEFHKREKANNEKEYIFVGKSGEYEIWKKKSEIGSWTYYLDEGFPDNFWIIAWDTITDKEVLELILKDI